jgi:hypothetical protein
VAAKPDEGPNEIAVDEPDQARDDTDARAEREQVHPPQTRTCPTGLAVITWLILPKAKAPTVPNPSTAPTSNSIACDGAGSAAWA